MNRGQNAREAKALGDGNARLHVPVKTPDIVHLRRGCWKQGGGSLTAHGWERTAPRVRVRERQALRASTPRVGGPPQVCAETVGERCLQNVPRGQMALLTPTRVRRPPSGYSAATRRRGSGTGALPAALAVSPMHAPRCATTSRGTGTLLLSSP